MSTTPFLKKLVDLVTELPSDIADWDESGTSYIIKSPFFQDHLKRYFKGSLQTFVRQLHFYGFSKSDLQQHAGAWAFSHPKFRKDNLNMIYEIQRKTRTKVDDSVPASRNEVRALKVQITEMQITINRLMAYVGMKPNQDVSKNNNPKFEHQEEEGNDGGGQTNAYGNGSGSGDSHSTEDSDEYQSHSNNHLNKRSSSKRKRKAVNLPDFETKFSDQKSDDEGYDPRSNRHPEDLKAVSALTSLVIPPRSFSNIPTIGEHNSVQRSKQSSQHQALTKNKHPQEFMPSFNIFDNFDTSSVGSIGLEEQLMLELEVGLDSNFAGSSLVSPSISSRRLDSTQPQSQIEPSQIPKFFTLDPNAKLPKEVTAQLVSTTFREIILMKLEAKRANRDCALGGMLRSLPDPRLLPLLTDSLPLDPMEKEVVPRVSAADPSAGVQQIRKAIRCCYESFYSKYISMGKPSYSADLCGGPCTF